VDVTAMAGSVFVARALAGMPARAVVRDDCHEPIAYACSLIGNRLGVAA
jgi:hypothetical protein